MKNQHHRWQLTPFSLIELLVVITILVILLSLLLPFLQQAKRRARGSLCTGNLKQLALAAHSYAEDHQNLFINCSHRPVWGTGWNGWAYHVYHAGYIPRELSLVICPETIFWQPWMKGNFNWFIHTASYSVNQVNFYRNQWGMGYREIAIPGTDWTYRVTITNRVSKPDEFIFLSDGKHYQGPTNHSLLAPSSWYLWVGRPWMIHHPSRVQTLFLDSHVEAAEFSTYQDLFALDMIFVSDPWQIW